METKPHNNGKLLTFQQYIKIGSKKKDFSNYRDISATNVISRICGKTIRELIEEENRDEEEIDGFRTRRSCRDIFFPPMNKVIAKRNATNQETHVLFVDLTKAYDIMSIPKLWEVLGESYISNTLIKAL